MSSLEEDCLSSSSFNTDPVQKHTAFVAGFEAVEEVVVVEQFGQVQYSDDCVSCQLLAERWGN